MALSQAAWKAEQALGHGDNTTTIQDVTNPGNKPEWGNPNETMKALAWMGKNKVEVGKQRKQPCMRQHLTCSLSSKKTLMSASQSASNTDTNLFLSFLQQSTAPNPRSSKTAM